MQKGISGSVYFDNAGAEMYTGGDEWGETFGLASDSEQDQEVIPEEVNLSAEAPEEVAPAADVPVEEAAAGSNSLFESSNCF